MADSLLITAADTFRQGGFVMPPLVLANMALWYAVGSRVLLLRRGTRSEVRDLVVDGTKVSGVLGEALEQVRSIPADHRNDGYVAEVLAPFRERLDKHRVLITSLAGVAPLLGLLGTVTGMIETFDALASMSLFTAGGGGIAGGVSEALVSTQMGLAVAIPGLLAGRMLDRKQHQLEGDLDALAAMAPGA